MLLRDDGREDSGGHLNDFHGCEVGTVAVVGVSMSLSYSKVCSLHIPIRDFFFSLSLPFLFFFCGQ